MFIWSSTSVGSSGNQHKKRNLDPDDSSDKSVITTVNLEVCGHCHKKCLQKAEAVQCDLCTPWVHAAREGLKREHCIRRWLNQLSANVSSVVYYCKLNNCAERLKHIVGIWLRGTVDKSSEF